MSIENSKANQESEELQQANAREAHMGLHDQITELEAENRMLRNALEACDKAFASWQLGQIPGRPEDILRLIFQVRGALSEARK